MRTTTLFRRAVRAAAVSQEELADEAGYHRNTFGTYMRERAPSRAAVNALADALDARAAMLADHAERLRLAADEAERVSHPVRATGK